MNDNFAEQKSFEQETTTNLDVVGAVTATNNDEGGVVAESSESKEKIVSGVPEGVKLSNLELTKLEPESSDVRTSPTSTETFKYSEYRQQAKKYARDMDNDLKQLISSSRETRKKNEDLFPEDLEGALIRRNDAFQQQIDAAKSDSDIKDAIQEFKRWFDKNLANILHSRAFLLKKSYQDKVATEQVMPQISAFNSILDNLNRLKGIAIRIERGVVPRQQVSTVEPATKPTINPDQQPKEDAVAEPVVTDGISEVPAPISEPETFLGDVAGEPQDMVEQPINESTPTEPIVTPESYGDADDLQETLSPTSEPEPPADTPVEIPLSDDTNIAPEPVADTVSDGQPEVDALGLDEETPPDPANPLETDVVTLKPLAEITTAGEFLNHLDEAYKVFVRVVDEQRGEIDKLKVEPVNLMNMDKWRPIVEQLQSVAGAIDALTPYFSKFIGEENENTEEIKDKFVDLMVMRKEINTLIVDDLRKTNIGEALGAKSTEAAVASLQNQVDAMPAGTPEEQETKEAQQKRLDAIKAQIQGTNEQPSALEKFAGITFKEFAAWNEGSDVGTFLSFLLDPVSARGRNGEKLSFGKYNEVDAENIILHEFRAKIKEPSLVGLALYKAKDSFQNIILKTETKEKMDKLRNDSTPKLVKEVLMDIYNDHLKTDSTGEKWKEFRLHFATQLFGGESRKYMDSKSATFLVELLQDDGKQLDSFWKIQ